MENKPNLTGKSSVTVMCPKCKDEFYIENLVFRYNCDKEKAINYEIKFRQIFYDIKCKKCNLPCKTPEDVKAMEDYEKIKSIKSN